jgi:hypothetical protein
MVLANSEFIRQVFLGQAFPDPQTMQAGTWTGIGKNFLGRK